jgi:hypothetical protein
LLVNPVYFAKIVSIFYLFKIICNSYYNDKIEIYFNTPLRNGPDDDRGCSFFVGVGNLPRTSMQKDEEGCWTIRIEMWA